MTTPALDAPRDDRLSHGASEADPDPSTQIRTTFLRRVAHDIASPAGVTLTVLDELAHSDSARPELIAMAKRSLRRLMRLSEHLALVAELESGDLLPEIASVDVRALTKHALDDALAVDGRKDVVAACELPSTPLLAAGDPRLLGVVLREVIGNALKLAGSRVSVSVKVHDENVTIRVDDDGPGFNAEALKILGRRFVRREASRGLGLSLSMAIDILRAHSATLSVEASSLPPSRRGTIGAAVVISIPRAAPPSSTPRA